MRSSRDPVVRKGQIWREPAGGQVVIVIRVTDDSRNAWVSVNQHYHPWEPGMIGLVLKGNIITEASWVYWPNGEISHFYGVYCDVL